MSDQELVSRRVSQACAVWETASCVEPIEQVPCRSGISLSPVDGTPRFCYVSAASPLEQVVGPAASLEDRAGAPLSLSELCERLLGGEVAAIVTSGRVVPDAAETALPETLREARALLRKANVRARFLLRQIGLEEVSAHRGAPVQLYDDIADLWSLELSLFTDPAMLLTLGADRQRYVDNNYTERATDRLPRALGRLHDLGVRSYPRLVIV